MMGMEAMLASMLGVKPDEMKAMFTGLFELAETAGERLKKIETDVSAIREMLERNNDGKG